MGTRGRSKDERGKGLHFGTLRPRTLWLIQITTEHAIGLGVQNANKLHYRVQNEFYLQK